MTHHFWDIFTALLYRFLTCVPTPNSGTGEPEAKVIKRQNYLTTSYSDYHMIYAYMLSQFRKTKSQHVNNSQVSKVSLRMVPGGWSARVPSIPGSWQTVASPSGPRWTKNCFLKNFRRFLPCEWKVCDSQCMLQFNLQASFYWFPAYSMCTSFAIEVYARLVLVLLSWA